MVNDGQKVIRIGGEGIKIESWIAKLVMLEKKQLKLVVERDVTR